MHHPTPALRPLHADDAAAVLAAFSSAPDMARQGEVTTPEEAAEYVANLTELGSGRHVFALTVDGELVGTVGVMVEGLNRTGWFWYWTHAAHRGRGWTSAAAATVADWALTDGGCERLELGHRENNPASGRVARAAGFVPEGRERGKFLIDDQRVDVLTYGRLATDPVPPGPRLPLDAHRPGGSTSAASPEAEGATVVSGRASMQQPRVAVEAAHHLTREEVLDLYGAVGWSAYTRDADSLLAGIAGSHLVVTARDGGRLVGLARAVSDGATIAYVQDVLVHPQVQRTGLGSRLLTVLLGQYDGVRQQVLLTDDEAGQRAFYESLGFTEVHDLRPEQRAFVRHS